ncbi:MAG: ATP-binding protein [Oscillospiraceae bacterium]|jgi:DNA replication protein DnaC|nr:ATP-binding protein [Oscillospiraceae bacterium]
MREHLLREILTEYEAQRAQNYRVHERRLKEASSRDPEIARLHAAREARLYEQARRAFAEPGAAKGIGEALQAEMAAMQAELRSRLADAGLPDDYLQPVFLCPHCRDTGYVGEPIRVRCDCFNKKLGERLLNDPSCGLKADETFERFDENIFPDVPPNDEAPHTQRAFMLRVRERIENYADLFPHNPRRNLLLVGKAGLGKTYLLNCIGNRVRARGLQVQKITAYQLSDRMRALVFQQQRETFAALLDVPLLLLDDLGTEPLLNNITLELLFSLLNERDLNGLHTVISSNMMLDELHTRYTERISSRLFDSRNGGIIKFEGSDVRLR